MVSDVKLVESEGCGEMFAYACVTYVPNKEYEGEAHSVEFLEGRCLRKYEEPNYINNNPLLQWRTFVPISEDSASSDWNTFRERLAGSKGMKRKDG